MTCEQCGSECDDQISFETFRSGRLFFCCLGHRVAWFFGWL